MRILIGAAALLFAATASAQTPDTTSAPATPQAQVPASRCPAAPAAPTVPDGTTVNTAHWNEATQTYEAWRAATQAVLDCRAAEAREAQAVAAARVSEYQAMSSSARQVGEAMTAAQTAFNARPARSRH
jgi:hypothetical protein